MKQSPRVSTLAVTCSSGDYLRTQVLAKQLCGSLYASNATLDSSVTAAITSATAAANAATAGKDGTDVSQYPACAQSCIMQNNYNGCGSLSDRTCICQGVPFNQGVGPCERASCSSEDLTTILYIAEKFCAPVGGILTMPTSSTGTGNSTNATMGSPAPSPFTGGSAGVYAGERGLIALLVTGLGIVCGLMML
ncbi:MAG: hypothetical protein Q9222_005849 [Ikaeria aurantiellina]